MLKSEHKDPVLYNTIRSLQFLFLHTYQLWDNLSIEENFYGETFLYLIENKKLGLRGYIGRDISKKQVKFLVVDCARIRWALSEGFDVANEDILSSVGIMMNLPTMNDFILFMAGRPGWDFTHYINNK
jgi:hypothetical protein